MNPKSYSIKNLIFGCSIIALLISGIWCVKTQFDLEPLLAFIASLTGIFTTFEFQGYDFIRLYKYFNYYPEAIFEIMDGGQMGSIKKKAYKYGFIENESNSIDTNFMILESPKFLGKKDTISVSKSVNKQIFSITVSDQKFLNDIETVVKNGKGFESVEKLDHAAPSLEHSRMNNLIKGKKYIFPPYKLENEDEVFDVQHFWSFQTTYAEINLKPIEFKVEILVLID